MLRQACEGYLEHNRTQPRGAGTRVLSRGIFPKKEYGLWLSCTYEHLLHYIYNMEFKEQHQGSLQPIKSIHVSYKKDEQEEHYENYHFGQLKESYSGYPLYAFRARGSCEREWDVLFLHNMLVINRLLYQTFAYREPRESEYSLCVKKDDSIIEKNKLYLSLRKNSDRMLSRCDSSSLLRKEIFIPDYRLEYSVIDFSGKINTASLDLESVLSWDYEKYAELLGKPLSEESLVLLQGSLPYILEITAKRGHTHADEELLRQLQEYRVQHHQVYECTEQTPLGWYMFPERESKEMYTRPSVDSSKIGNNEEWSLFGQFRVMPPINTAERPIKFDDYDRCVHLPYIESKKGTVYPLSVQISNTVNNLKSLVDFMGTLPKYSSGKSKEYFKWLSLTLNEAYPIFECEIKALVVSELVSILNDSSLSDKEAVNAFEAQLKNHPDTLKILTKSRQSQSEYLLKLLSVFSILIGVGIFTTLGLMCKRLYDSSGTSINFFKPLSQNLTEDIESITASIEPSL